MPLDAARAKHLFLVASEIADPAERDAYLIRECLADVELRGRVEALLRANASPPADVTGAFTPNTIPIPNGSVADDQPGIILAGRYKLGERIGEGGMGSVWVAYQTEPVKRKVAIKLIKAGMDSKAVIARFEAERQALAMMDHPNIAKVLDGGLVGVPASASLHDALNKDRLKPELQPQLGVQPGRPFFVMELVKGVPITEYCDKNKLTPRQRLELFIPVCNAIQHAHQKGIIHRDIKPSNVLIALYDDKPVPKVIDFGVAKATGTQLTEQTLNTGIGAVVGTPEYMSPEQASLNNIDIDTRSDVYSLGVLLYELLTGSTPVDRKSLGKAALLEILRIVREVEAPRPSTKLSSSEALPSIAANRHMEPAKLSSLLKGELDWVVLKALEKDRSRRYDTANGLARDIQRYLDDEIVEARPPSASYRIRKFIRRHRGQVLAASLVFLALVAGVIGTSLGLVEARHQESLAHEEATAKEMSRAEEAVQRKRAVEFRDKALDALRATTGTDVEQLIGGKQELGANEKAYLEAIAKRWQTFAKLEGADEQTRAIRAEGHFRVAYLLQRLGRKAEAQPEHEEALHIREKLVLDYPTVPGYRIDLAHSRNNLGFLLMGLGKLAEALEHCNQALVIRQKLADDFPAVPEYRRELAQSHNNVGSLLTGMGKRAESQEQYDQAIRIREKLAADFPSVLDYRRELAASYHNRGLLMAGLGKRPEALAQYTLALAIQEKLVADYPTVPDFRRELARTRNTQGQVLADLGQRDEAEQQYKQTLVIQEKLVADFPTVPDYRNDLAFSHKGLGLLLAGLGKRPEAQQQYNHAIALGEKLAADFPNVPDYRHTLAVSHNDLGLLLADQGKRDEALEQYNQALVIREKLVADFPASPDYRISLGGGYCNFGNLMVQTGRAGESLGWYDKAIATLAPVHRTEPRVIRAKQFLRNSHLSRAAACDQLQKYAEAAKDWDQAIELSLPVEQAKPRASRAMSRLKVGMVAEAVAEVAELTTPGVNTAGITQWPASQWCNFARIYSVASSKLANKKEEYANRAMELLQQAVKAGYQDFAHLKKDTELDPLRDRDDFKKLLAELEAKQK